MMNRMPGRLGSLTARDVMSPDVQVLSEMTTLEEAVQLLRSRRHSGAPVVDSRGHLVGTFSLRDLTGVKASPKPSEESASSKAYDSAIITGAALEKLMQSSQAQEKVADRMTKNAPSVTENATLIDVARLMCDFHTHRMPVTDAHQVLVGIITTMDILAALVHTADELSEN